MCGNDGVSSAQEYECGGHSQSSRGQDWSICHLVTSLLLTGTLPHPGIFLFGSLETHSTTGTGPAAPQGGPLRLLFASHRCAQGSEKTLQRETVGDLEPQFHHAV